MKPSLTSALQSLRGRRAWGAILLALAALALLTMLGGSPNPVPSPSPAQPTPSPATIVTPTRPPSPTPDNTPSPQPTETAAPSPTPLSPYAPLDGMPADPLLAHRLPLAVMIDSNARSRPQAGFNRASIVYHAPNDGGTNRYMFIFQEQDAELVGPVRSTRPFFNGWVFEYRAAFGHFGGDSKSVRRLREVNGKLVFDVDALSGSGRAYWRDGTRRAPFNAYSSTERLWAQAEANGAPALMVGNVASRTFADDLPPGERPISGSIAVPYRGNPISYRYDHESNSYLRFASGEPHRDALDGSRVTARNVIVQFVSVFYDPNQRYNRAVMDYVGSGSAIVFRDGLAIEGTWIKEGEKALTRFLDSAGDDISLVRGSIYIQVVPERAKVTYEVGRVSP